MGNKAKEGRYSSLSKIFDVYGTKMREDISFMVDSRGNPKIVKLLNPHRYVGVVCDLANKDPLFVKRYNWRHFRRPEAKIFVCSSSIKKMTEDGKECHRDISFLVLEETLMKYFKNDRRLITPTEMACAGDESYFSAAAVSESYSR